MKLTIGFLAACLLLGCVSTVPNDDATALSSPDARTGLCNDATPPPCNPPKD
jgi:hypothetical protein